MTHAFEGRIDAALGGTHAVVDLDAFAGNVRAMRRMLDPHGEIDMMAVIKANAYGHGAVVCGKIALEAGANLLGVARIEEGLVLRDHGITSPILVLGPFNPVLALEAAEQRIAIAVGSTGGLARLRPVLQGLDGPALEVHLKIDSGMHRYGVYPEEAIEVARALRDEPGIDITGLFTHFATADEPNSAFLDEQRRRFESVREALRAEGLEPPHVHITNSAACLRGVAPEPATTGTRIFRAGIALYGLPPSADVPTPSGFRRVMTLKTRLGRVFTLHPGEGVSYGLTFVAEKPVRCGTVPIGYGDGLNRLLSNHGWMSVGDKRCPILGRVCMDQTVIDISSVPDATEGDEVIVFGDGSGESMTADDAAAIIGTINYEVVTAILPRVPRVYLRDGIPAAVADLEGLIERD
jgi:alanine racemase